MKRKKMEHKLLPLAHLQSIAEYCTKELERRGITKIVGQPMFKVTMTNYRDTFVFIRLEKQ